jgi:hypothetical protein
VSPGYLGSDVGDTETKIKNNAVFGWWMSKIVLVMFFCRQLLQIEIGLKDI